MWMRYFESAGTWVLHTSLQASLLAVLVLLVRMLIGRSIPPRWMCWMWLIVGVRLMLPGLAPVHIPTAIERVFPARGTTVNSIVSPQSTGAQDEEMQISVVKMPLETSAMSQSNPDANVPKWEATAGMIWAAGTVFMLLRLMLMHRSISRQIQRMTLVRDPRYLQIASRCASTLGVRRSIQIVRTDRVRSPAVYGIRKPVVLLPASIYVSDRELHLILMHEFSHLRNRDGWVNVIASILRAMHWFNPLIWLAFAVHRADRELLCDATAMRAMNTDDRNHYAQCLVTFVERLSQAAPHPAVLGIFGGTRTLKRRITMITHFESKPKRALLGLFALLLVGCAAVTAPAGSDEPAVNSAGTNGVAEETQIPIIGPSSPTAPVDAATSETRIALAKIAPEVSLDNVPFADALAVFKKASGTNLFINWKALETEGIDRNVPISANYRNITYAKYLDVLLSDVGGGADLLGYSVDEGVITVSTKATLDQNVLTHVYDIRDLLVLPDQFDSPSTQPGASPADSPREQMVRSIISLICDTVNVRSWKDNGGMVGSIRELSGQLIVTQTPETQAQIGQLLEQLREARVLQISIEARMIMLNTEQLPKDLSEMLRPLAGGKNDQSAAYLSEDQVTRILNATQAITGSKVISAPRVTIFNGQRAQVRVTTETNYISSISVQKTQDGTTRFDPVIAQATSGVIFDVQGTCSADRKYVTMTLKPELITLKGLKSEPFENQKDVFIQKPELEEQEVVTTASVPDRGTLLLRTAPVSADGTQMLFILVKPTLIIREQK